jgi:putative selenium metabolism protein SsnA
MNNETPVIKNGAILIKDDKITQIGQSKVLEKDYYGDEILDANSRVVMPGMICSHMHFYSAFATGMHLPPFPKGFVEVLENLWWKLDKALLKEDVYYSALLGYIEAIRNGTTTIIDHHASPNYINGSLDEIEKAGREIGVRSNLCYEITNRNGDEQAFAGLKENERFLKKSQQNKDDFISGLVGLHASFTVSDQMLENASELERKYNSGIHIHVAEGKADMEHSQKKFNKTVVERLNSFNLLNNKSILAHCIHIKDSDLPLLKKSQVNIVHQPRSNMNNAVGTLDIFKLLKNEISFGLGTDGMSSDMKAELLVTPLIHKHVTQDNTLAFVESFNSLFQANPKILKSILGIDTGKLAINQKADVLITNYYPKTPITQNNIMGHIMFGVLNNTIDTTIINGKICMKEGKIQDINLKEVSDKAVIHAQDVWNRIH